MFEVQDVSLGLTISKHIVERLGGQIWVLQDHKAAGTTIGFTMQAYDEQPDVQPVENIISNSEGES